MSDYPAFEFDWSSLSNEMTDDDMNTFRFALVRFFRNVIRWSLEVHVSGQRKGKIPQNQGMKQPHLELSCFEMMKHSSKDGYEVITMEGENGKPWGDMVFGVTLNLMLEKNEIIYNKEDATIMPNWVVPFIDYNEGKAPELQDRVLDGVEYPLAAKMSPDEILYYSEHKDEFTQKFPNGKLDYIIASARHLREGIVIGTEEEIAGTKNWLYTIVPQAIEAQEQAAKKGFG